MKDIILSIVDDNLKLDILVKQSSLESVANTFGAIFDLGDGLHVPRYSAGDIIMKVNRRHDTVLMVPSSPVWSRQYLFDRVIYALRDKAVMVYNNKNVLAFNGSVKEFLSHVRGDTLVGKTVVFRYTSGTVVGNRVVKLEKIERKNGTLYYCGKDLKKGEFRRYDKRYIDGDILVVDGDKVDVA